MNKMHSSSKVKKDKAKVKKAVEVPVRENKWDKRLEETFPASDAIAKY